MPVQGTDMFLLQQRLKHIKLRLKEWNKKDFGNIFKAKREVEKKLQGINQILITYGFIEERKCKLKLFNKNGKTYASKRRFSGGKN